MNIEASDWAKRFKQNSPVSYPQAMIYAAQPNLEVVIEYRTDVGEGLWAIIVNDDHDDFWMEACTTQAEAIAFCEAMGWNNGSL